MSLLDGGGAALLTRIFSPLYLPGTVYAVTTTYDRYGEPTETVTETPCRIQIDSMTESMRSAEGSADTDRRAIVLNASVTTDDKLSANAGAYAGSRWLVMSVERDPAASHWICRVRRDPTAAQ